MAVTGVEKTAEKHGGEKVTGKKVTGKLWREKVVGNSGKCAMRANAGGSCFFGRFVFVGRFTVVVPARKRGQNAGGSYFKNSWNSRKSGSTKSGKSVAGCCFLSCFVFCVCVFFWTCSKKWRRSTKLGTMATRSMSAPAVHTASSRAYEPKQQSLACTSSAETTALGVRGG